MINGHMEICDKVTVTGMGMVMRPITEPGVYSSGIPLQTNKEWRKTAALTLGIDGMNKRLKALEKKLIKILKRTLGCVLFYTEISYNLNVLLLFILKVLDVSENQVSKVIETKKL